MAFTEKYSIVTGFYSEKLEEEIKTWLKTRLASIPDCIGKQYTYIIIWVKLWWAKFA
jgi:hypothetical protein